MCGITGIFNFNHEPVNISILKRMTDALRHRGPDDEGYMLIHSKNGYCKQLIGNDSADEFKAVFENIANPNNITDKFDLAFGHRRLSIIDLSSSGHQPMSNEDETIWLTYNGEVYNYIELKDELIKLGHTFRSTTDTEVIIHAYEEWGRECLNKFNGMWAFAIWDQNKNQLFCARDRFGIKPFYYYKDEEQFFFASEIKALLQCGIKCNPNEDAIGNYLAFGMKDYSENTFFDCIKQLMPGHYMLIDDKGMEITKYYDLNTVPTDINKPGCTSYEKTINDLLLNSIKLRLRSDVAVGSNLSGGIDSSIIVSCISSIFKAKDYVTYSFFTRDAKSDESDFVNIVSREKNVANKHTYLENVDEKLICSIIKKIDEPFRSFGILSIDSVFNLVSTDDTKVILDGQGADEVFFGYGHHYVNYLFEHLRLVRLVSFVKDLRWVLHHNKGIKGSLIKFLISMFIPYFIKDKIKRYTLKREGIIIFPSKFEDKLFKNIKNINELTKYSLIESPLPEYLNFEDKISMSYSVEARVPFLDYMLVEYGSRIPYTCKIHDGIRKYVLRESFKEVLPTQIYERMDKKGMTNDEELLFKTALKDYVNGVYSSPEFKARKYWNADKILSDYNLFIRGQKSYNPIYWRTLAVELWLRMYW